MIDSFNHSLTVVNCQQTIDTVSECILMNGFLFNFKCICIVITWYVSLLTLCIQIVPTTAADYFIHLLH